MSTRLRRNALVLLLGVVLILNTMILMNDNNSAIQPNERQETTKSTAQTTTSPSPVPSNHRLYSAVSTPVAPTFYVDAMNSDTGYLDEVYHVLGSLGWQRERRIDADWQLLWKHEFMFNRMMFPRYLRDLKPHQRINKVPGIEVYTSKVNLAATQNVPGLPVSFSLPKEKNEFLEYISVHPYKMWVSKSKDHRGIMIFNPLDGLDKIVRKGVIVQEFVGRPFTVDGHKFDMGVYTAISSVQPLMVYVYDADTRLRFCPHVYEPFDINDVDKYVVGSDFMSTAQLPSLKPLIEDVGLTDKEALKSYIRSQNRTADKVWTGMYDLISRLLMSKAEYLQKQLSMYANKSVQLHSRNFFELQRFDMIVDDDMNVFMMEANMSPNLGVPPHHLDLRPIIRKLLYSLFSLVGIANRAAIGNDKTELPMIVADNDIQVYADKCKQPDDRFNCKTPLYSLCRPCLLNNRDLREALMTAYQQHMNRNGLKRIIPPPINENDPIRFNDQAFEQALQKTADYNNLSALDKSLWWWFRGKCQQSVTWCS